MEQAEKSPPFLVRKILPAASVHQRIRAELAECDSCACACCCVTEDAEPGCPEQACNEQLRQREQPQANALQHQRETERAQKRYGGLAVRGAHHVILGVLRRAPTTLTLAENDEDHGGGKPDNQCGQQD